MKSVENLTLFLDLCAELDRLHRELQTQTDDNARLIKQLEFLQLEAVSARTKCSAASGMSLTNVTLVIDK